MPSQTTLQTIPEGDVTFRGRGHGIVRDRKLFLKVCPICSQRNAPATAGKGFCQWCAYVPSLSDAEPSPGAGAR